MSFRETITDRALRDIAEAVAWYENEAKTLGEQLRAEIVATFKAITANPFFFPVADPPFRGARCKRFPYKIYYAILPEEIVILAVYHLKRDPNRWNDPDR